MGIDAEMCLKIRSPLSAKKVRRLAYEVASAFGASKFWIWRPGHFAKGEPGRHAIEIVDEYRQDGPDILPRPGEQLLQVHLGTRYYGIGYERGDLPFIIDVARWFEVRLPLLGRSVEVWYGGDSSGVLASPFNEGARTKLFKHFVAEAHRPYEEGFDREKTITRRCDFCEEPMTRYSWGGGGMTEKARFACSGCGLREKTEDGGRTFVEMKKGEDDLF